MLKEILTARARPSDKALYNIWARKISGGWTETTLTGALPLTFLSEKVQTLTNYRIYGTAEGAGVQTESGEPAGYKIPILLQSKNLWNKEAGRGNSFYFYMNFITGTYMSGQPEYDRIFFVPIEGGKEYEITLNDTYQNVYTVNSIDKPANGVTYKIDNVSTFINHGAVRKAIRSTNAKANWLAVHIDANNWENVDATIKEVQSFPIYIGSTKLGAEEYLDYESGKVWKMIDGTLTPTDPPAPLPAITAYKGENTLSSTETVGSVSLTGKIKEVTTT